MARATTFLLLACLCGGGFVFADESSPIAAWSAAPWLNGASSNKVVPATQALQELFAAATGAEGHVLSQTLAGLLDAAALADAAEGRSARADAVVVLVGSKDVQQGEVALQGAAGSLTLTGAEHEGAGHPVFEALHAAAPALGVKVLGDCGGALVPAGGPATEEVLRQELAAARSGAGADSAPAVLVLCPGPGAEAEAALLQAAASALAEVAPGRWLLVRTAAPADAPAARQQRRRLAALAVAAVSTKRGDAANRTSNYTVCDSVCHKHVMWLQGIISAVVILIALTVGCCCMHLVDVPTRFAQGEARREHAD